MPLSNSDEFDKVLFESDGTGKSSRYVVEFFENVIVASGDMPSLHICILEKTIKRDNKGWKRNYNSAIDIGAKLVVGTPEATNDPLDRDKVSEYTVLFTAENIMLVFGDAPDSHLHDLEGFIIDSASEKNWGRHNELERLVGAKLSLGQPHNFERLFSRLNQVM